MNYDLSKVSSEDNKRSISPYIGYGSGENGLGQVLRINEIELKFSKNTGSPKAILHMESKPIKEEGFTPIDGHTGRVGKIACGIYMKDDKSKSKFLEDMKRIAICLGLEEDINEIKSESFPDAVSKVSEVVSGKDKWASYTVFGEEYQKLDGKKGTTYFLPKYNFVQPVGTEPTTLVQFDINNKYHLKRLPEQVTSNSSEEESDLPF